MSLLSLKREVRINQGLRSVIKYHLHTKIICFHNPPPIPHNVCLLLSLQQVVLEIKQTAED